MLYAAVPSSLLAILAASVTLATVQWAVIDHAIILAWLLCTNLLSIFRLVSYLRFKKLKNTRIIERKWLQLAYVTTTGSGLSWGAAGYFLFATESIIHQVFLAFVVAGMTAGAISTLAAVLNMARTFVLLAVLPAVLQFALAGNELSLTMSILTIFFVAMLMLSSKRLNQTIVESLSIRYQRELAQQTIRHHALYDDLTNLPNRRHLLDMLRHEMATAKRHKRFGAVFFIDLDRFKSINDSLGHAIGDELLVETASLLSQRLRKEDTAARLGGDEFVVLLAEIGTEINDASAQACNIADDMRRLFEKPFNIDGHEIHLSISIGIALFPLDVEAEDLLKYADVAMYQAKRDGRDQVRLFSSHMQEAVNRRRQVEHGLRSALENDEFELYFQAQYDGDQVVYGAESLIRWNHPEKGLVAPAEFIDIAEQTGLILPIGDWVLRSACEHLTKFAGSSPLKLSVNVSPRQFASIDFIERLDRILQDTGADPARLVLEITESLVMADIEHSIESMNQLRDLGIVFSLDDFGTGYSSLSYLNRLPVEELKIDRSFIRDITRSPENAVIVDTIIVMARQLKLEVVAEGVETEDELNYLKQRDCRLFQGFYFSRPEPFDLFNASISG